MCRFYKHIIQLPVRQEVLLSTMLSNCNVKQHVQYAIASFSTIKCVPAIHQYHEYVSTDYQPVLALVAYQHMLQQSDLVSSVSNVNSDTKKYT
jgi:hypothetical protein